MNTKEYFTDDLVYAILMRKKEVQKTYVILSKFMSVFDMAEYTSVAEHLILGSEELNYVIDKEHVIIDYFKKDLWMDEAALHVFRNIMEGFIDSDRYDKFLDLIESGENIRRLNNRLLSFYREKSIACLSRTIIESWKQRKVLQENGKMVYTWLALELLSRTRIPKIYYFIRSIPIRIKTKLDICELRNYLSVVFPTEE